MLKRQKLRRWLYLPKRVEGNKTACLTKIVDSLGSFFDRSLSCSLEDTEGFSNADVSLDSRCKR